ncbi:DUF7336 domain-containing protein [Nocardia sp. CA-128927]|uniref:DUF7336 domain-containing protein n=1 Tax=Nocardia sp. CA-128927 TaxID=3239975 RepID=UPI003D97072B
MQEVYVVQHYYGIGDDYSEGRILGMYSSEAKAESAARRARALPGFCDHPDDFHIVRQPLNKDAWVEGFFTYLY